MTEQERDGLVEALRQHFAAEVELEPVNGQGRYRFGVTSSQFAGMPHMQRQDAIWNIVDQVLPRDVTLDVSLILAFAPSELSAAE